MSQALEEPTAKEPNVAVEVPALPSIPMGFGGGVGVSGTHTVTPEVVHSMPLVGPPPAVRLKDAVGVPQRWRDAGDAPDHEDTEEAELNAVFEDGFLLPSAALRRVEEQPGPERFSRSRRAASSQASSSARLSRAPGTPG
jgi:hypothetical protein